jgi:hypothetical protein
MWYGFKDGSYVAHSSVFSFIPLTDITNQSEEAHNLKPLAILKSSILNIRKLKPEKKRL